MYHTNTKLLTPDTQKRSKQVSQKTARLATIMLDRVQLLVVILCLATCKALCI